MKLHGAGNAAGVAELIARAEGRAAMEAIETGFEKVQAEERQRLAQRTAQSKSSGRFLIAIDVTGVGLILCLAIILMRRTRRSNRELSDSLSATRATNESLEAAVAERTEHLVAANEKLRHSSSVLQSTFHSMAEAVLVIDTKGEVLLSNPAAEKMLRYRPGMNITGLRARISVLHADGVTPMKQHDMPVERSLRGEEFDGIEFVGDGWRITQLHLAVSGRPLRDAWRISGAALSITISPPRAKPSASCSKRKNWTRSDNSPAASRMISTTCSP